MSVRYFVVPALLFATGAAPADETVVYESLAAVQIGRVFLAPGDRERLDERRLHPPAEGTAGAPVAEGAPEKSRALASAGYIISSSGRARVWRDGDFVESTGQAPRRMKFPGDVTVIRTVPEDAAGNADTEDQLEHQSEADSDAD